MNGSSRLLVALLALFVAGLGIPPAAATDAELQQLGPGHCVDSIELGSSPSTPPAPRENVQEQLSKDYRSYWSDDSDHQLSAIGRSVFLNMSGINTVAACSMDISWADPPDVSPWVAAEHDEFDEGDDSWTVHPSGTTLSSGSYIKDAYVRIFSITPSTVVKADSGEEMYIDEDGTVRALIDFRTEMPTDDTTGTTRHLYSSKGKSIDSVSLLVDGEVVDTVSPSSKHPVLHYSDQSDASNITVRATLNVSWVEEFFACSGGWSGDGWTCNGTYRTSTESKSNTFSVTTTKQVTVADPTVSGTRGTFPDNQSGAYFETDQPWRRIVLDTSANATVQGRWRFYSRTPTDYLSFYKTKGSDTQSRSIAVRPLQVYAIPATQGAQINRSGYGNQLRVTDQVGPLRNVSAPANRVEVTYANPTRELQGIAVRSNHDPEFYRDVRVKGIVRGTESSEQISPIRRVRRPNVSVHRVERTKNNTTLELSAQVSGTPVSQGTVQFRNRSVPLSGPAATEVVVTGTGSRAFQATFVPDTGWWAASTPMIESSQTVVIQPSTPGFTWILELVLVTILWFIPLGLLLLGFDYLTNGRLLKRSTRP